VVVGGDGRHAVSIGADAKIALWSIADSQPRWTGELGKAMVHQVAFRAGGSELTAACGDGHVRMLSAGDGALVRDWPAHEGPVQALAWRADGQELASAGRDGTIRLWNPEGKESAKIAAGSEPVQAVAWSSDGSLLQAGGRSKLWQTFQRASLERVRQAEGHNQPIVDLRYSANGQRVATLDDTGKLFVWDAASGTPLFHQQLAVAAAYRLAWSPDASEIVVATSDPRVIRLTIPLAAR
jgi:WD40 repeat protein